MTSTLPRNSTGHVSDYVVEAAASALYEVNAALDKLPAIPAWESLSDEQKRSCRAAARQVLDGADSAMWEDPRGEWTVTYELRAVVHSAAKTWRAAQAAR